MAVRAAPWPDGEDGISQAPEQPRNLPLDFLRGICAIAIALYHYLAWTNVVVVQSTGMFGVYMFFVISAFVMMMTYADRFRAVIGRTSLTTFYWRRFARIVPLLALVSVVAYFHFGDRPIEKLVLSGTGVFALHMPGIMGIFPGVWTLGIELAFYAVFPLICLIAASCRFRVLVAAFLSLVVAQQVLLAVLPPPDDPAFWGQYTLPLTFAPFFAGGIVAYRLSGRASSWNGVLAAALVVAVLGFSLVVSVDLFEGGASYMALTILSIACVYFTGHTLLPRALRGLAWFVGEISYSLYLTHWRAFALVIGLDPSIRLAAFAVTALLLATLTTFLFERPVRRFLRERLADAAPFDGERSSGRQEERV